MEMRLDEFACEISQKAVDTCCTESHRY